MSVVLFVLMEKVGSHGMEGTSAIILLVIMLMISIVC